MEDIVQLVERQIVILVVVGSSPISHPIFIKNECRLRWLIVPAAFVYTGI